VILVTVGMQLGFDRLIEAMDRFAQSHDGEIVAQIGKGAYRPRHMEYAQSFEAARFDAMVEEAQLIVSHAGIGSVLTARRHEKPIVIMPRRAELGEHRNDHQMASARQLDGRPLIHVAFDESQWPSQSKRRLRKTRRRQRSP